MSSPAERYAAARRRTAHPALADLEPARMVGEALTAPLHPGAARYFREAGLE